MKIAIPVAGGKLSQHFGHCEVFTIFEIDDNKKIISVEDKTPPEHIPGIFPEWIARQGVTLVISGGMGGKAQDLFRQNGVSLVLGVDSDDPREVVEKYLKDSLEAGANSCSDSGLHGCGK